MGILNFPGVTCILNLLNLTEKLSLLVCASVREAHYLNDFLVAMEKSYSSAVICFSNKSYY